MYGNVVPWGPTGMPMGFLEPAHFNTQILDDEARIKGREESSFESSSSTSTSTQSPSPCLPEPNMSRLTFFSLPLEIRLQIYSFIHHNTPVRQPELAPWLPNPEVSAWFLQTIMPDLTFPAPPDPSALSPSQPITTTNHHNPSTPPRLLSPHRPRSGLPTALLRASRRIYHEARTLPFAANEFAFPSWFASGVAAARAFTRARAPWQRAAMRFARVEVPARGLQGELGELVELCGYWGRGMRGLRLRIECGGAVGAEREKGPLGALRAQGVGREWVTEGLGRLRGLRQLEVELAGAGWTEDEMVEWCWELEGELNRLRGDMEERVRVVCVKKVGPKMVEDSEAQKHRETALVALQVREP